MLYAGQRLKADRYEAVVPLRRGGMGVVWRGLDRKRGDEVALKVLAVDAGGVAAMEREAEAALRVPHPNVLAPRDTFVDGNLAVLVLELCAGSVADVLAEEGALTPGQAFALLEGPLDALGAAHGAGVVHRDVKPSNLLVRGDGTVLLADFGIARMLADARATTRSAALLGSLPFMAPEQRRDPRDVSPATDVYAAAATLATMLTGAPVGDLFVPAAHARLTSADVPDDLCAVLARAGSWDPTERPSDARALLAELRACPSLATTASRNTADEGATLRAALVPSGRGWSGDEGGESGDSWGGRGARPPSATPSPGSVAAGEGVARGWVWALAAGALVVGVGAGVWAGLQDGVRGRLVKEDDNVRWGRFVAALPACDAPKAWTHSEIPRTAHDAPTPREAGEAIFADADGDGRVDVVIPHMLEAKVRIYWGTGARVFPNDYTDVDTSRMWRGARAVAVGDIDGDLLPDLVYPEYDRSGLAWVRQSAARRFEAPIPIEQAEYPSDVYLADTNQDNHLDVILRLRQSGRENVIARMGAGDGSFGEAFPIASGVAQVAVGPADRSGLSIAIRRTRTIEAGRWSLSTGLVLSTLTIVPELAIPQFWYQATRAGDVSLWVRLHGMRAAGLVRFSLNSGEHKACVAPSPSIDVTDIGDFDMDGVADVVNTISSNYSTSTYALETGERNSGQ